MSGPPRPPRLVERLLELAYPPGIVREDVVGAMAEEHGVRVRRLGQRRADAWYARQVVGIVAGAVWRAVCTVKEEGRMGEVMREIGQGIRRLVRAPVFTFAVVATLALGIGGTTAVFAIVHGVLIRPLPYPDAERLVWIRNGAPDRDWSFSMADLLALLEQQSQFSQVGAYDPNGIILTTPEGSERLQAHMVSAGFMPILGIEPLIGRGITEMDTRPGAERVALLSHALWRTRFGGDPGVVGRSISLDQQPTTVIGVLPPPRGPIERDRDFVLPLTLEPPPRKGPFFMYVVGHLKDGASRQAASEELTTISERIFPIWQDSFPDDQVRWIMLDLREALLGDVGTSLWLALAGVVALLLIALTNAANLMVARAAEREREAAVRAALGAGWGRMLIHRLSESAILAGLGAAGALVLAWGGLAVAVRLGGAFVPRVAEAALTGPVVAFLLLVTGVAVGLLALVPALHGGAPLRGLSSGSRTVAGGRRARRLRQTLVAAQLSITMPLLVGGALLASSLGALRNADTGFDADRVLTLQVVPPRVVYETPESIRSFWGRVLAEVRALPGVEVAGRGNGRPPDEPGFGNNFVLEDVPIASGASQPSVPWTIADPAYFEALGVELLAGRMFDRETDSARVALVDETWARRFFAGPEDAVGRRFVHGGCTDLATCPRWTVIGVVSDVDYNGVAEDNAGAMYLDGERFQQRSSFLVVRTAVADPVGLVPAIRSIVREADPRVPVTDIATGTELLEDSLRTDRYLTGLIAIFGTAALLLSLVGVYGVITYFVEQHRRDIGIRLALGGAPGRVVALVMGSAMRMVLSGVGLGSVIALVLSGLMERLLFGVDPKDPASFLGVALGLSLIALLACSVPALRASHLDPAITLREE